MEITLNHRLCRTREEVQAVASSQVADFLDEWYSSADFVWGHTSGSTGAPKPIKLLKHDMEESARLTVDYFGLAAGTTMLLCLSPDYIAGKMMIVRALLSGADLLVVPPSSRPLASVDERIDFAVLFGLHLDGSLDGSGTGCRVVARRCAAREVGPGRGPHYRRSTASAGGRRAVVWLTRSFLRHLRHDRDSIARGSAPYR